MKNLKVWIPVLFVLLVLVGVCTFLIRQKPLQDEVHAVAKEEMKQNQEVSENNQTEVPAYKSENFKIVGYYPEWKPEEIGKIQYEKLTHINYAFAIPKADGTLMPLANPELAKKIIADGHKSGVNVLLAIGGWEYEGKPLEMTFIEATSTDEKIKKLVNSILEMVDAYGFDGVDMDWEHPRMDGPSKNQYAALMQYLSEALHAKGKLLSAAVVSGVTADGNVLWDAAGHLDEALEAVDYINVMAYDGGDGERHSSYEFAVNSALYWKDTRGVDKEKIVLGVPFYGRPRWLTYDEILKIDDQANNKDNVEGVYYNGIAMMEKKAEWAKDNVGGIMIWELAGDCNNQEKSLLNALYKITMQ